MIIEVYLDGMTAQVASLREQTVPGLRTLAAETTAVADGSVSAKVDSADMQVFSNRLNDFSTVTLPASMRTLSLPRRPLLAAQTVSTPPWMVRSSLQVMPLLI